MSTPLSSDALFTDIGQLIQTARSRVAVNAELTLLYWHIGRRIKQDMLQGDRAQYGKQIVEPEETISRELAQLRESGQFNQDMVLKEPYPSCSNHRAKIFRGYLAKQPCYCTARRKIYD